jgi:hypothetical protein
MPRIRSRRSARAAPIPAWKTPRTWPGNSIACCAAPRRKPARELSRRAQRRGRREHPRIDPLDRFHGAELSHQEARLRKAVLSLAKETEFGKRMVNGGRLSVPSVYDTPLSTADAMRGAAARARRVDAGCAVAARRRRPTFLTDAFITAGTGSRCWSLAMARRSAPDGVERSASAAMAACRSAGLGAHATMPSPARLSAAARRLCRRALPASDRAALEAALARAGRDQLRFVMALSTSSNFAKPDDAFAPSSRRIAA